MKVTKKMKRFAALLIAAVVMLSGVPLPSVQAAGDAKGVDVLEFTVKNEKGNPVPGVRLTIFNGTSPTGKNLESNASGMVRWTPEASDDSLLGSTLTVKPVGPETTDAPLTFELGYIYSSVGRIEIKMINGQPASEVSDPVLVVKGGAAETQDNKKQLVVNVKDQNGNPVNDCAFVMKDSAWPNNPDGMAKYPTNGVLKFTLSDGMQLGGTIRVHSWSSADYEGNELRFTSKNKEFLTVNGEEYDGIKEYTIVVTKKGEKPEVNREALEQKITDAKAIKNENYTEASWNALQAAITAAEAVRDDADATQDVVDAQVTALEEAINGLKVNTPQGDKKVLVVRVEDQDGNPVDGCAFVMKDSAFPDAGDGLAKYPSNGVVKFTLSDGMQFGGTIRVHSMSSADYEGNELTFTSKNKEFLTVNGEAYDGIKEYTIVVTKKGEEPEKPEVNKEALEQKITAAKAIENKNYTEASWNALQAAITAAEAVCNDADATQDDVAAQVTALETAINALEEKEPEKPEEVNKDELKKAIDAAKAIENKNYTEASWNALQAAIAAAEAVRNDADATQDDVDAQVTALKNAVDGLKENSEKPNPEKPNPEKPNTNKPNTNKPNIDKPNADKNENAAPKTGDSAPFVPCVAGMICAAAVAGMALKKRKSFE